MQYGILIDITKCIGCYACEQACSERWAFPTDNEIHELSAIRNTAIKTVGETYLPRMCMHCQDPTCASVCPVGAFEKTAEGPVVYDVDKCIGCRYCMQACPFDVPRYQWESMNPKVTKCDMCRDRILQGQKPACVKNCPAEARIFGTLDEIIREAKKRVAESPETYNPKIYGINEVGGTSVIYISGKPVEELGMRAGLPGHALPDLTWAIMQKIPNYVFWGTTLLGGVWWITNRRKEVQALERKLREMEQRPRSNNHED